MNIVNAILHRAANSVYLSSDKLLNNKWFDFPFGKQPKAGKEKYIEIWEDAKSKKYPMIDDYEKKAGFAIDEKWFHELALHTQVVIKKSDICYQHGRLLYSALRKYLKESKSKFANILETGTARGFSSLCMAKAMSDAQTEGKIITFDVLPHNVQMYWNCIDDNDGVKSREELLRAYSDLIERYIIFHQGDTRIELPKVFFPKINFAFLDGAHTYNDVLNEFNSVKDKQETGDIIFFDDYTPKLFPGIVEAVDEICDKFNYKKEIITVGEQRGYVIGTKG